MILLIGQQVRPGDIVEVKEDGIVGRVLRVSVRATVVETFDGAVVTYSNAMVLTKEFQNWTSNNMLRRNTLAVGVSYGTDLSLAMRLMLEAAQSTPGVMARPAPEILCTDFGSSSVDFALRYWASVNTSVLVGSNLRREIYRSFAEHGIGIPFPQLDIHIQPESEKLLS
ncbi:putative MscS family protein.1 [bioreactor metagenome]|uniref:Putative MscS family protein.1 n=1 Tax=bioreactor metagenome TaxID=1076179 RepID=A0A645BWC7_9ZZZZ